MSWWSDLSLTWKIISTVLGAIALVAAGWKPVMGMWGWWKEGRLKKYSRILRDHCDLLRSIEPNFSNLPFPMIEDFLKHNKIPFYLKTRDVLEFMEGREWASKLNNPVNCWRID
jgi:hypothetical protein